MPIRHWPEKDRPREKLIARGAASLSDAELIAIILGSGSRGMSALDIAKTMLSQHGSLKHLLDSHERIKGIGAARQASLRAAIELGKRYLSCQLEKGEKLNGSSKTQAYLSDQLRHLPNEIFACLMLDTHLRLIQYVELFHGTINEASVYPREIIRHCLKHHAAKVILAHNHPSGIPTPSTADREITHVIKQALALVDIHVIDHIIVGAHACYSFAEHHLL